MARFWSRASARTCCQRPNVEALTAEHCGSAEGTGNRHIDPFCYLSPGQASITKVQDLLGGGGMSGRTARTRGDAGALELLADSAEVDPQLGPDLAQGPALGDRSAALLTSTAPP